MSEVREKVRVLEFEVREVVKGQVLNRLEKKFVSLYRMNLIKVVKEMKTCRFLC